LPRNLARRLRRRVPFSKPPATATQILRKFNCPDWPLFAVCSMWLFSDPLVFRIFFYLFLFATVLPYISAAQWNVYPFRRVLPEKSWRGKQISIMLAMLWRSQSELWQVEKSFQSRTDRVHHCKMMSSIKTWCSSSVVQLASSPPSFPLFIGSFA